MLMTLSWAKMKAFRRDYYQQKFLTCTYRHHHRQHRQRRLKQIRVHLGDSNGVNHRIQMSGCHGLLQLTQPQPCRPRKATGKCAPFPSCGVRLIQR